MQPIVFKPFLLLICRQRVVLRGDLLVWEIGFCGCEGGRKLFEQPFDGYLRFQGEKENHIQCEVILVDNFQQNLIRLV